MAEWDCICFDMALELIEFPLCWLLLTTRRFVLAVDFCVCWGGFCLPFDTIRIMWQIMTRFVGNTDTVFDTCGGGGGAFLFSE